MIRAWTLGTLLTLALCGAARAQVETVVVSADGGSGMLHGLAFVQQAEARLTQEGKRFVEHEAKQVHDGASDGAAVRGDARSFCAAAFGTCGDRDAYALAAIVFERAILISTGDQVRLMQSLNGKDDEQEMQEISGICGSDAICLGKKFLASLPPDRRHALQRIWARERKIGKEFGKTLASAGFDTKGDK